MKNELTNDILKVLYTEEQIRERVKELGAAIAEKFAGQRPLFVGILKGSVLFLADLIRACPLRADLEMMAVSSYGNAAVSSGRVRITYDIPTDVRDRDLIIVEDILDSGNTLSFLKEYLNAKGAASVTIVTLLDKPSGRQKAVTADYVGFPVPDAFVVGYGLDYAQLYRNLPCIGILKPEVYEKPDGD
ncbi:MAG: hypoxanthine phosphoribosyltransferase [Oscillibacter sp.]|nr:hypoxanthine phosphoribosyltransferase [Oscillibacter sp.]